LPKPKQTKPRQTPSEPICFGHNHSWLAQAEVADLRAKPNDPWRCTDRELTLACAVVQSMPSQAALPIVVNGRGEILVGHIFVEAARKLGIKQLTVTRNDGLSEVDEKRYIVAITQILSKGNWDPFSLEEWIREFEAGSADFNHLDLGFDNGELDKLLGMPSKIVGGDADAAPKVEQRAVSRLGMLWHLGRHRILAGDATNLEHMIRLLEGKTARIVVTDPPFGCPVDGFVAKRGLHRNFVQGDRRVWRTGISGSSHLLQIEVEHNENELRF